ncbi:hypothetical protein [Saccharomonospora glauca]|uniref:hypothetical protein n=1 Tax=Saccharomonospora glauca TaxID=40990 RepID=UPI0003114DBA|nr:hypothetical protein [Saccharomonospora glauca]
MAVTVVVYTRRSGVTGGFVEVVEAGESPKLTGLDAGVGAITGTRVNTRCRDSSSAT